MNVSYPIKCVVPSLDAHVLEVLAGTTRALTGRQVHRLAGAGSDRGIRLVLGRLVRQGLAIAEDQGSSTLYTANRAHLAWPAVEQLVGLRTSLIEQLSSRVAGWGVRALHASMFGSAARQDGDEQSDIDLLLVRADDADDDSWNDQVTALRKWATDATGNPCQVFDVTISRFEEHVRAGDPLVADWRRDGLHLGGTSIETLVRAARSGS
jgi:predicted nucleotidyltransferase